MPSYRPCTANISVGTKMGAASSSQILSLEVVLFKGGRSVRRTVFDRGRGDSMSALLTSFAVEFQQTVHQCVGRAEGRRSQSSERNRE